MKNPVNRIENADADSAFGEIDNRTNFKIAREELIQESLIYGKNTNWGNPPYFQISGEGIVYYEKNYIIPSVKRIYTLLISRFLIFIRDMGENKYDILFSLSIFFLS